jgi:hypothetical protein
VDGSDVGNVVSGTSVGTMDPDCVVDRVEVATTARLLVGISPETSPQELNSKRINRKSVTFLIMLFSQGLAKLTV